MKATFFLFFFFYKNVLEGNNFTQKIDLTVLIPALCDCIDRGIRVLGTIKIKKLIQRVSCYLSCWITSYYLVLTQFSSKAMGGSLKLTFANFLLAFQLRFSKGNYSFYYFRNNVNVFYRRIFHFFSHKFVYETVLEINEV